MNPENESLEQLLLELHYGLLDETDTAKLRARIETDAEVAAKWAQTLAMAGNLADAAKLAGSPATESVELLTPDSIPNLPISRFESDESAQENANLLNARPPVFSSVLNNQQPDSPQLAPPNSEPKSNQTRLTKSSQMSSHHWTMGILGSLAAMLFVAVSLTSWVTAPESPATAIRVDVESVESNSNSNHFEFLTQQVLSHANEALRAAPAQLAVSIQVAGATLHTDRVVTDSLGRGAYSLPTELAVPPNATLLVSTPTGDKFSIPLKPTRCLTYFTTDRPIYRPGETVRFRSLSLERYSLQPNLDLPIRFQMLDPSSAVMSGATLDGVTDRGVGNGEFTIPATAAGGQYTLVAKSLDGFFPDESKTIQVRNYRVPRFKKDLEFKRRSYGPGDLVEAEFVATHAEGGPLSDRAVIATAQLDGETVFQQTTKTDVSGTCLISFKLPAHIAQGNGQLSIAIDDGGTQEVQSKTIPIQLGKVSVAFYPEGGYLVDGLQNRVYFTARNPTGKPIHVAGEVLNRAGQRVAEFETVRDGMGRFELAPLIGERYSIKITKPVDVTNSPTLPTVVKNLPVLSTGRGVFTNDQNLAFEIQSTIERRIVVQAGCRGRQVANQTLDLKPGKSKLEIELPPNVEGVVRLTILDAQSLPATPLVERLVYRESSRKLNVSIEADKSSLERSPGEPMRLTLSVVDEHGQPAPAMLGVAVVDDAALSLETTELPGMPAHFLLTSEIEKPQDLEHANFYLSGDPDSKTSLDLLLGTQGWRRFVSHGLANQTADVASFNEQLNRLLDLDGASNRPAQLSNVLSVNKNWAEYSQAVAQQWQEYRIMVCWLVIPILAVMLLAQLRRPRLQSMTKLSMGLWILIGLSYSMILGCGQTLSSSSTEARPMADSEENALDEDHEGAESPNAVAKIEINSKATAEPAARRPGEQAPSPPSNVRIVQHAPETRDFEAESGGGRGMGGHAGPEGTPRFANAITPEKLQQLLHARGLDVDSLSDQLLDELRFPIREYAHQYTASDSGAREDFAETIYWQPCLITDSTGRATIRFDLPDSVTTFKVIADANTSDGRLGTGGGEVVSRIPFQLEPKLPIAVTQGDRIDLPVALINATNSDLPVELEIQVGDSFKIVSPAQVTTSLGQHERARAYFSLEVLANPTADGGSIELMGNTNSLSDAVRKSIIVSPAGYPARDSVSGMLTEQANVTIPVPANIVNGSLQVTLKLYPSPLADLMAGVESILREPHGCFEQTSATNYPNTMALQYLNANQLANPKTTRRAKSLLDKGYQKLVSFECEQRGYEWFGSDPGHEALSAFGLMQFVDMAQVMKVDTTMVVRTRNWLLARRDGEGGFQRNPRHLHVWSVKQQIVDAYVMWALTESDRAAGNAQRSAVELAVELNRLNQVANESKDPYLIGLAAAALLNVNRDADGEVLLDRLAELQQSSGALEGVTTVTQSGGISKTVETTAIAILAWSKKPTEHADRLSKAAIWLQQNRQGNGGFGSTQATVLALKALVAYSNQTSSAGKASTLLIKSDGQVIQEIKLPSDFKNGSTIEVSDLAKHFPTGRTTIKLVAAGSKNMPYSIDVAYHLPTPPSHEKCPFELETRFESDNEDKLVAAGGTLHVVAKLTNRTDQGQPMTVATIGLPGGVEPRVEQLDELRDAGKFDFYEIRPRQIICYWRTIAPNESKSIEFDVSAEIPGRYSGPASSAYLYYTAEQKVWSDPLKVEIGR